jgi:soluble lytic murein transglycosylase-like protein
MRNIIKKSWYFRWLLPFLAVNVLISLASAHGSSADSSTVPAQIQSTQQASVVAAMQASLAQQQASLDRFRNYQQSTALQLQHESVIRQMGSPTTSLAPADSPVATSAHIQRVAGRKRASAPIHDADGGGNAGFFTTPWLWALPLPLPNVQVVADSCEALGREEIAGLVEAASKKHGVDTNLLTSLIRQESDFRPCATSVAGAMGLMQIMPGTADMLGLVQPYDAAKNVDAGAKFLKMMLDRYQGDLPLALGAYNAGPGAVDKADGVPPIAETMQYVSNILRRLPARRYDSDSEAR